METKHKYDDGFSSDRYKTKQNKPHQQQIDFVYLFTLFCCCCCCFFYFVIVMAVCICFLQNFVYKTSAFDMLELLECDVFESVAVCTYLQWVVCPDWIKERKKLNFFGDFIEKKILYNKIV